MHTSAARSDITDLKRAEEALTEADRRKNEFLAMLAHELRNPLAPIRNALEILRLTEGRRGSLPIGFRNDGSSDRPNGPAGGRLARCEPNQPGQD